MLLRKIVILIILYNILNKVCPENNDAIAKLQDSTITKFLSIIKEFPTNVVVSVDDHLNSRTSTYITRAIRGFNFTSPVITFSYTDILALECKGLGHTTEANIILVLPDNQSKTIYYCLRILQKQDEGKIFRKYFILIETMTVNDDWLNLLFDELANKHIFNANVFFRWDHVNQIYGFQPFSKHGLQIINKTNLSILELFPNPVTNLWGNQINVTIRPDNVRLIPHDPNDLQKGYYGVDGEVAKLISERINATFNYIPGPEFNSSKYSGILGAVAFGNADMSFNVIAVTRYLYGNVEKTSTFERNNFCLIVPKRGKPPNVFNLFHILTKKTWITLICTWLLFTILYQIVQHWELRFVGIVECQNTWTDTISILFQAFIGDAVLNLPSILTKRFLIFGWITFSLLMNSVLTGKLISSLVRAKPLPEIDTFQELVNSQVNINAAAENIQVLSFTENKRLINLLDGKITYWNNIVYRNMWNTNRSNNAYIGFNYAIVHAFNTNFDKTNNQPYYHLMKECLAYSLSTYLLKKGSPYIGHLDDLVRRFHETGFHVHWIKSFNYNNSLSGRVLDDSDAATEEDASKLKVVIKLEHVQIVFYMWVLGIILSLLAFVSERIKYKRDLQINKINMANTRN